MCIVYLDKIHLTGGTKGIFNPKSMQQKKQLNKGLDNNKNREKEKTRQLL